MRGSDLRQLSRRGVLAVGCGLAATITGIGAARARETIMLGDAEDAFARAGFSGAFAAHDPGADRLIVLNAARAETRFAPASTFKIPNSLIALEIGAVKDADEVFRYDGKPRQVKAWERDMTLREAIAASNVPVYQEIARRVGLENYRAWLARLDYGNREVGKNVERFWLDGPLAISAVEQALFLARLAEGRAPVSERAHAIVREIIRIEAIGDRTLFAKTGWDGKIGWWVGWIEQGARRTAFALNMDMSRIEQAPKRIEIGKAMLAHLGVY
ncbi:MAG TPA: class D beta-lactamase [Hyphomicrobiaceae bacterium]|nr:class D beta-lactamase [Hyphomicrobiaceae bacterium]